MKNLAIVRGAGDLASGIIARLHNCGFDVVALECPSPKAVRRLVSYCEALWRGEVTIEGITAAAAENQGEITRLLTENKVPVLKDPEGHWIQRLNPGIVIDATLLKKNITTSVHMAPIVIGVGPGHEVGVHCHGAVESKRGHHLGRIYYSGSPFPNTGIPGTIAGYGKERVYYAPASGTIQVMEDIGSIVEEGQLIARIDGIPIKARIAGLIRGMLRDGTWADSGMKVADIDPRVDELDNCHLISDKARAIAGGVLEGILALQRTAYE